MTTYGGYNLPIPKTYLKDCIAGGYVYQDPVSIPGNVMEQITGQRADFNTGVGGTRSSSTSRSTSSTTPTRSGKMAFGIGGNLQTGYRNMNRGLSPFNLSAPTIQTPTANPAVNTQLNMPPAQTYTPYGGGGGGAGAPGQLGTNLDQMTQFAQGMMDPNSDYYKRLSSAMQEQIGKQTAAQQRAAALRAAQSGLGGGMGAERMATTADIGQAGLEAQGQAEANLALQAPQLGMQGLQSTFSPYLGVQQLGEQSRQFGANLGEQARQFGAGMGLSQQQMAQQMAYQQAQMQLQQQLANQQALMQQYSMLYGML